MLDAGPLAISELMASNDGSMTTQIRPTDEDPWGEVITPDWIEIHNPTASAVDLEDWYLTDNADALTKWRFPNISLGAGQYMIVFASGLNVADRALDEKGFLHTNFQLDADGEYLALVHPNGTTISSDLGPEFPRQEEDFSYGVTRETIELVSGGDDAKFLAPDGAQAADDWTALDYVDASFTGSIRPDGPSVLVTEIENGTPDWFEIQNVADIAMETDGWIVAVNDGAGGNINAVNPTTWALPTSIDSGEVLFRTDQSGPNYFGRDIAWDANHGWVMILDNSGDVVDFLPWGYSAAQIASLRVNVAGFTNISVAGQWTGPGPTAIADTWNHGGPGTGNPGQNIGSVGASGSYTFDAGTYTVRGSGADIWGRNDEFYYVSQSLVGDTEITARIDSIQQTDVWAKAGVMIRESTASNSRHAMMIISPGSGGAFQYRRGNWWGSTEQQQAGGLTAPHWVKLKREGNNFTAYQSADGANWQEVGSRSISMNASVRVGLAVTSHNDGTLCTAEFSNVTVGGQVSPTRLQRIGDSDDNTAANFVFPSSPSQGAGNADLAVPFAAGTSIPVVTGLGFDRDPEGGTGQFEVEFYKAAMVVDTLSVAKDVIVNPGLQSYAQTATADVINYFNTGSEGNYAPNNPFPSLTFQSGNGTEDFVVRATTTVVIPSPGFWTFGVNSDDGFELTVTNGNDTFYSSYAAPRGPGDTLAPFNVAQAGVYDLELIYYERGGGAELELFAAQGSHGTFNPAEFDLVGDVANGGLALGGVAGAIGTNVEQVMHGNNASLWLRVPFVLEQDPSTLDVLSLRMMYNDGFVAYLNGRKIAEHNAPELPTWNSTATAARSAEASYEFVPFDVTAHIDALQLGSNVLAIHGLNVAAGDDSFLVLPELVAGVGDEVLRYFDEPTPGAENGAGFIGFVKDTRFSGDRGFYTEPFDVTIATNTPLAKIYYTTDGSAPTETNGTRYTSPIRIDGTTVLRAAAFKKGYYSTNVDTQTYLFLDDVLQQSGTPAGWPGGSVNGQVLRYGMDSNIVNNVTWGPQMLDSLRAIPTMSLVTDLENLFGQSRGIYVNPESDGHAWERPASLELIYPDDATADPDGFPDGIDEGFQIDAGVRLRGGYSRSTANPKHAFRMFFRKDYGDGKLNYPLFGDEGADSFDKVDLRTSQNYSWGWNRDATNTFMRDVLSRDSQGAMGQPYTRSRFYHLYINGQYWGLYQTQERSEAAFGASYFGGEREDYDVVKHYGNRIYRNNMTDGVDDPDLRWAAFTRLFNAATAGFATDEAYYGAQGLDPVTHQRDPARERMIDVDNLIDYMISTFYTGDRDAPISNFIGNSQVNNYFGVYNRENPDGWKWFRHDGEHTLDKGMLDRTGPWTHSNFNSRDWFNPQILHQKLVSHPDYRQRFADRVHLHFHNGGVFDPATARENLQYRADQIDTAIIAHSARWGQGHTKNTWLGAVNTVRNWLTNGFGAAGTRTEEVISLLQRDGWYPYVDPPALNQHGGQIDAPFSLSMENPNGAGTIYYTLDGTDPRLPGGGISPEAEIFVSSTSTEGLIAIDDGWSYNQSGDNLGTIWRETAYNDAAWPTGDGLLYNETSALPAPTNTPLTLGPTTFYFRTEFEFTGDPAAVALRMRTVLDDGAVFYLNGEEVYRLGMDDGPFDYGTFANRGPNNAQYEGPFSLPVDALVEGTNVLAVEVHQVTETSSDIVFGLQLDATTTTVATPIDLEESSLVSARVQDGGQWSAVSQAQFYTDELASPENLIVTEINYHPHAPTGDELATQPPGATPFTADDFEFIELVSLSHDRVVDLTDVQFVDGIEFAFNDGDVHTLQPGQRVVVVKNAAAFEARYGEGHLVAGTFVDTGLSNGGEDLRLDGTYEQILFNFEYDDENSWPGRADGKGATLVLTNPAAVPTAAGQLRTDYLGDGRNWQSSVRYGGTPGEAPEQAAGVVVNEVLSNAASPERVSIELHNASTEPIDVGGWYLSDSWGWDVLTPGGRNESYQKYRIRTDAPPETTIPAGGYLVFDDEDFNPTPNDPQPNHFTLDAARDNDVWLMKADAAGSLTHFGDHVETGAQAVGESWGRWPDGSGRLYPLSELTPGAENLSPPRLGSVILSEVHYHPGAAFGADELEFVEIYNTAGAAVDLSDWRLRKGIEFDFAAGSVLGAFGTLVVVPFDPALQGDRLAEFLAEYAPPGEIQLLGPYSRQLDDDGERVQLQRPGVPPEGNPTFYPGLLEDEVIYDDEAGWPAAADGLGSSLGRNATDAWGNSPASWSAQTPTPGSVPYEPPAAEVVGHYIFYNDSSFDGNNPAAGADDDGAIAPDKQALLPGSSAAFANYTSYSLGLNGIMVDVAQSDGPITADDFAFRVGNTPDPTAWDAGPEPAGVTVRAGDGTDGSDRVTIVFDNHAIRGQWLEVTVLPTGIGLSGPDVFYFGNAVAEAGNSPSDTLVTATDLLLARNNSRNFLDPAAIDFGYDFDRDQRVNATDVLLARNNQTNFLNALWLVDLSGL